MGCQGLFLAICISQLPQKRSQHWDFDHVANWGLTRTLHIYFSFVWVLWLLSCPEMCYAIKLESDLEVFYRVYQVLWILPVRFFFVFPGLPPFASHFFLWSVNFSWAIAPWIIFSLEARSPPPLLEGARQPSLGQLTVLTLAFLTCLLVIPKHCPNREFLRVKKDCLILRNETNTKWCVLFWKK